MGSTMRTTQPGAGRCSTCTPIWVRASMCAHPPRPPYLMCLQNPSLLPCAVSVLMRHVPGCQVAVIAPTLAHKKCACCCREAQPHNHHSHALPCSSKRPGLAQSRHHCEACKLQSDCQMTMRMTDEAKCVSARQKRARKVFINSFTHPRQTSIVHRSNKSRSKRWTPNTRLATYFR